MAQIIKLRRSALSGQKPTNSNLQLGELAINTTDGKVFLAKSGSLGPTIEELISTNTINTGSVSISGSIILEGNETITGSLTVTQGITGSLFGTSSWANNSLTSSFITNAQTASYVLNAQTASFVTLAQTASYVLNAISSSYAATASSADTFIVRNDLSGSNARFTGDITAQTLHVQIISSSVEYSSGSNIFGDNLSTTQQFTGSVSITGSLSVAGNVTLYGPAGTDNGNSGSYVTFKNSNNIIGYVTTNQSTDVMTGILGYRSSDGNLIFSEVIDGGTF